MENVSALINQKNIHNMQKVEQELARMGYNNFIQVLDTRNYGLPQHRERVFMISIKQECSYEFPPKMPLNYKLKDMLSKNVDEKYYLSEKMINYISATGTKNFSVNNSEINCKIARPLTTEQNKRAGTTNYISKDLPENYDLAKKEKVIIKENNSLGYKYATEGDGINISTRMEYQRGNVQKDSTQTLKTDGGKSLGVVVKNE